MARAIEVFRQNAKHVAALSAEEADRNLSIVERADMMALLQTEVRSVMQAASAGNFERRVPTNFSDNELNDLAIGINGLVEAVDRGLAETGKVLSAIANTDLTQRITGHYEGGRSALSRTIPMPLPQSWPISLPSCRARRARSRQRPAKFWPAPMI